jgi:enamine deaminase RidA (YjgF/YER057c/UK114 family)
VNRIHNPAAVHQPATLYSHGVEVPPGARWLVISGQVGVRPDGSVAGSPAEQMDQAFENLVSVLQGAGMEVRDLVKVTVLLTRRDDIPAFRQARERTMQGYRPAWTLILVAGLASPDWVVEIEAVAARA